MGTLTSQPPPAPAAHPPGSAAHTPEGRHFCKSGRAGSPRIAPIRPIPLRVTSG
jgi:hypothetical protein